MRGAEPTLLPADERLDIDSIDRLCFRIYCRGQLLDHLSISRLSPP